MSTMNLYAAVVGYKTTIDNRPAYRTKGYNITAENEEEARAQVSVFLDEDANEEILELYDAKVGLNDKPDVVQMWQTSAEDLASITNALEDK